MTASRTIPQVLDETARVHGSAPALRQPAAGGYTTWSWNEYRETAREIAAGLHSLGIHKGETVAILSEIDLLISNDMGLAHVAPAVGTKTIAIFGPTNDETTRPYSFNAEVIRKKVECSPCMLRDCPIDHRCMTQISVDEVFEAAKRELADEEEEYEEATGSIS